MGSGNPSVHTQVSLICFFFYQSLLVMLAGLKPTFSSVSPCVMLGDQTFWAFLRGRRQVRSSSPRDIDEKVAERPAEPGLTTRGRLPSSPLRAGCALPAGGSAIAVTVGSATAAVPQGSSFIWPSFTVTTTSRSIWRGESHTRGSSWLPRFRLMLTIPLGM